MTLQSPLTHCRTCFQDQIRSVGHDQREISTSEDVDVTS